MSTKYNVLGGVVTLSGEVIPASNPLPASIPRRTQVITIRPDGALFGLAHKKGQGLDLRPLGHADIQRATLIEWDGERQRWFIRWESESAAWTYETWKESMPWNVSLPVCCEVFENDGPLYFQEYEDAVAAEIAVIQSLQRKGRLINH